MGGYSVAGLFVGLTTLDVAQLVDRYPDEDTKTRASSSFIGAGGPAANAAVAFAALSAAPTELHTVVGGHQVADIIKADLAAHQVSVVDAMPDSMDRPPVSSVVVASQGSSRTVVSLDGTLHPPPPDHATAHASTEAAPSHPNARIVLADGHYPTLAVPVVTRAKAAGATVVLDCGRWRESHDALLPLADIAICSAGWRPPATSAGVTARLRRLEEYGVRHAAMTGGHGPIRYLSAGVLGALPVEPVVAVDTLGAGDILHGAFCHFMLQTGGDFEQSLRAAAHIAALSCQQLGTRAWIDAVASAGSTR